MIRQLVSWIAGGLHDEKRRKIRQKSIPEMEREKNSRQHRDGEKEENRDTQKKDWGDRKVEK